MVRAGEEAFLIDEFIDRKIVSIGWNEVGALKKYTSREPLKEAIEEQYPQYKTGGFKLKKHLLSLIPICIFLAIGGFYFFPTEDFGIERIEIARMHPSAKVVLSKREYRKFINLMENNIGELLYLESETSLNFKIGNLIGFKIYREDHREAYAVFSNTVRKVIIDNNDNIIFMGMYESNETFLYTVESYLD